VKEISTEVEITPIYHAPEQVKGYVNIRGQIYLVIDLRLLLGYEQQEVSGSNKIVIFKNKIGEAFGVLVDSIGDVVEVSESDIEDMQKQDDTDYEFDSKIDEITEGVCRLEKTLLVIINPKHFLPEIRKLVDAYK
jgi:chemotaxis signal transduction protein